MASSPTSSTRSRRAPDAMAATRRLARISECESKDPDRLTIRVFWLLALVPRVFVRSACREECLRVSGESGFA